MYSRYLKDWSFLTRSLIVWESWCLSASTTHQLLTAAVLSCSNIFLWTSRQSEVSFLKISYMLNWRDLWNGMCCLTTAASWAEFIICQLFFHGYMKGRLKITYNTFSKKYIHYYRSNILRQFENVDICFKGAVCHFLEGLLTKNAL